MTDLTYADVTAELDRQVRAASRGEDIPSGQVMATARRAAVLATRTRQAASELRALADVITDRAARLGSAPELPSGDADVLRLALVQAAAPLHALVSLAPTGARTSTTEERTT